MENLRALRGSLSRPVQRKKVGVQFTLSLVEFMDQSVEHPVIAAVKIKPDPGEICKFIVLKLMP